MSLPPIGAAGSIRGLATVPESGQFLARTPLEGASAKARRITPAANAPYEV